MPLEQSFLYSNTKFEDSTRIIIVLPEMFGLDKFVKNTVDKFARQFNCICIGVDIYYPLLGESKTLNHTNDSQLASELAQQLTAETYLSLFKQTLNLIQAFS